MKPGFNHLIIGLNITRHLLENISMLSSNTRQAFSYNPYFTTLELTEFPPLNIAFATNIVALQDDKKSRIPEKIVFNLKLISMTSCPTSPCEASCYA